MAAELAASVIDVRYGADAPWVLKDLTLAVRAGEFVGVVGPNGSGKSTLLRALSRALRPARGAVLLGGHDLYGGLSARDSAQRIGVVPQSSAIAFDFTVREVVRMGRAPRLPRRPFAGETAADEAVVEGAMRAAGVLALAERIAGTLSGGEMQRALLARALAQEPDVLLLDEPTAHLDIHHQAQALSLARALAHERGLAVLAVLHDLNLAAAFCDRLILLHGGRIAAQGTPAEVLTAEHIQAVYGARVWVRCHPATGRPVVLSLPSGMPGADRPGAGGGPAVHVICGGGTGAALLVLLHEQGLRVTAGGLNAGDTDQEAAEMLGIPYAREAPFSALSDGVVAEAARLLGAADVVVLTDVPFGRANLAGLEAALAAREAGKPVCCLQPPDVPFASRDFTEGAATRLWEKLAAAGAVVVPDAETAMTTLLEEPWKQ